MAPANSCLVTACCKQNLYESQGYFMCGYFSRNQLVNSFALISSPTNSYCNSCGRHFGRLLEWDEIMKLYLCTSCCSELQQSCQMSTSKKSFLVFMQQSEKCVQFPPTQLSIRIRQQIDFRKIKQQTKYVCVYCLLCQCTINQLHKTAPQLI